VPGGVNVHVPPQPGLPFLGADEAAQHPTAAALANALADASGSVCARYLVISQAIELYLKAFIVIRSGSPDVVQGPRIPHNLQGLLAMAEKFGFAGCSQEARDLIAVLQPLHKTHCFQYRNMTRDPWPSVRVAVATLDGFAKAISPVISKAMNSR
jgi:hypothetical protein